LRRGRPANAGAVVVTLLSGLLPAGADAQVSLGVNRLHVVSAAGTPAQNCQNLRGALAAITDATAAKPYVLRLEPGEYDCGSTAVVTKSYVDIEGSGEGVTRIFGTHDATSDNLGVVDLVDRVELRFVTVENTGNAELATAVSATTAGESRVTHATIISDDTTGTSCGMFVSLPGGGAAESVVVEISDSTVRGAFDGLFLQNGTGKVMVRGSTIEGGASGSGVHLVAGDVVFIAYSKLINGFDDNAETVDLTCLFSYDGNLEQLDSGCSLPAP